MDVRRQQSHHALGELGGGERGGEGGVGGGGDSGRFDQRPSAAAAASSESQHLRASLTLLPAHTLYICPKCVCVCVIEFKSE